MKSLSYLVSMTLVAGSAAFVGVPHVFAQTTQASKCDDPRVDMAACKHEKAAAAHAKQQGKLTTKGEETYQQNALKRCESQPEGPARESCRQRVMGAGNTTVTGSVKGGGTLSTNTITVPATDAPKN